MLQVSTRSCPPSDVSDVAGLYSQLSGFRRQRCCRTLLAAVRLQTSAMLQDSTRSGPALDVSDVLGLYSQLSAFRRQRCCRTPLAVGRLRGPGLPQLARLAVAGRRCAAPVGAPRQVGHQPDEQRVVDDGDHDAAAGAEV